TLSLFYRACDTDGGYIILRPGRIIRDLLRGSRRVWCDQHQCSSMNSEALELFTVQQGWRMDRSITSNDQGSSPRLRCLIWSNMGLKDLELLVALASCDEMPGYEQGIFVSHGECLPCHLAAATVMVPVSSPGHEAQAASEYQVLLHRVAYFI
ncbi:predicted protein, partial [Verticillium alfalfae VaMs.102]